MKNPPSKTETPSSASAFRSGFAALLGEPNVGKSTLLNALLGFKVAIVSPKPQTTRQAIKGIYSDDISQIVFVDTPGLIEPKDRLNECLRDGALQALEGADLVLHLVEANRPRALPPEAARILERSGKPVFLVVNKSDLLPGFSEKTPSEALLRQIAIPFSPDAYHGIFFVSALTGAGIKSLIASARAFMPEGPPLYDPDQFTDRDLRFLAAEIVREKALENTAQEIPYAIATQTESFQENPGRKHLVRVAIHVEHDSQKAIVIGRGGEMLRRIGAAARSEIETLCGHPVFLELWVKVRKNWRKKEEALREFGYWAAPGKKARAGKRKKRA